MDAEMEKIDRKMMKLLASDTKVSILQKLAEKQKTPSGLSKEMAIAPSTVVGHLKELELFGLVKRQETQHKWIYYKLTEKGENIFKPRIPFQLILSITLAIIITVAGTWNYFSFPQLDTFAETASGATDLQAETARQATEKAVSQSDSQGTYAPQATTMQPEKQKTEETMVGAGVGNVSNAGISAKKMPYLVVAQSDRNLFAFIAIIGFVISVSLIYTIYKMRKKPPRAMV